MSSSRKKSNRLTLVKVHWPTIKTTSREAAWKNRKTSNLHLKIMMNRHLTKVQRKKSHWQDFVLRKCSSTKSNMSRKIHKKMWRSARRKTSLRTSLNRFSILWENIKYMLKSYLNTVMSHLNNLWKASKNWTAKWIRYFNWESSGQGCPSAAYIALSHSSF